MLVRHLAALSSPADRWATLARYRAVQLGEVLQPVLDPDVLGLILAALRHGVDIDAPLVHAILETLKKTRRWGINALMCDAQARLDGETSWKASGGTGSWS